MKSLVSHILSAGLGLWLATIFIAGVVVKIYPGSNFFGLNIIASWELFILFGIILGLLNYFVKPILNIITLPLRIITLGLFGFVINMALLWIVDYIFKELNTPFFWPLFWTSVIIWAINFGITKILRTSEQ